MSDAETERRVVTAAAMSGAFESASGQVCAWIAGFGLVVPSLVMAQGRTDSEVVELIVRGGPRAQAIRAETDVARREQLARLAYPNPAVTYSGEPDDSTCRGGALVPISLSAGEPGSEIQAPMAMVIMFARLRRVWRRSRCEI